MNNDTCGHVYNGPTYPEFHGTKCELPAGHGRHLRHGADIRHPDGSYWKPLSWWDAEQKQAINARRAS